MESKVILVTGASDGIGAGIAATLVESSAAKKLALVARRKEKLESVAAELRSKGAKDVLVVAKDLSDYAQCEEAVKETVEHFGRLDVLINNAGVNTADAPVSAMSTAEFDRVMTFNVTSQMAVSKSALPHLRQTKGNIVFISSIRASNVVPGASAYGCSKAALTFLSKTLAAEEAARGVRVNTVSPGAVLTDMLRSSVRSKMGGKDLSDAQVRMLVGNVQPLPHSGSVADVGAAVAFLADGDRAAFVTGADVVVDGGMLVGMGANRKQQQQQQQQQKN